MALSIKTFSSQLLTAIGNDSGITTLVGTRYYKSKLPQLNTFPALRFTFSTVSPTRAKDGVSDYDIVGVQFDCYALRQDQADELGDAVRTAFDRYTNEAGTIKFHETFFQNWITNPMDFDTKTYSVTLDFDFHIK